MEFLLAQCAGDNSDSESIRSDVSETYIGSLFQRRPGSGRRKQQVPWRSPWDAREPPFSPGPDQQQQHSWQPNPPGTAPRPIPSNAATPTNSNRRKTKQDLAGPCCHCNAVSSPQWRKGPKGKPILCNACGIRFLRTRTLGKSMPKKRRVAVTGGATADAVNNQPKRSKADEPATEDEDLELAADEGAATEDVVTADDGAEEAHSVHAGMTTQLEHPHASVLPQSRLAIASSAMDAMHNAAAGYHAQASMDTGMHGSEDVVLGQMYYTEEVSADQESEEQEQVSSVGHMSSDAAMRPAAARGVVGAGTSSSGGTYSRTNLLNRTAAGSHQPLAAGSRHFLLGSNSRLNHSPVLSLALALHQQHQYSSSNSLQQQQQPGSPPKADDISLSGATASPISHCSNIPFRSLPDHSDYAASGSTPASPMLGFSDSGQIAPAAPGCSGVSSMLLSHHQQQLVAYPSLLQQASYNQHQLLQYIPQQQQQHSMHGPSPLGLQSYNDAHADQASGVSATQPLPAVQAIQCPSVVRPLQSLPAAAAAANGDVMHLVRQMASALGGIGPAFDLLSTINANRQAAAAAASASAAGCTQV